MPIRNGLPYLLQAYASLSNQSLDDWELVAVMDGCTDGSEQFLRNLDDPRVIVIDLDKPAGLPRALNIGLVACRANVVARLDADDECHRLRLERQLEFLHANPQVALVGTAAEIIDADGTPRAVRRFRSGSSALRRALLWRNQFIHSSVMFIKPTVLQLGGYDERMVPLEDYELWLRIAAVSDIDNIPDTLVRYRQHDNQSSRASTIPSPVQFRVLANSRRCAAAKLGVSISSSRIRDVAWLAGQFRRELRLRLNLHQGYG
jgi:glycosyltransferase involved in cell wall biosynthesis